MNSITQLEKRIEKLEEKDTAPIIIWVLGGETAEHAKARAGISGDCKRKVILVGWGVSPDLTPEEEEVLPTLAEPLCWGVSPDLTPEEATLVREDLLELLADDT